MEIATISRSSFPGQVGENPGNEFVISHLLSLTSQLAGRAIFFRDFEARHK